MCVNPQRYARVHASDCGLAALRVWEVYGVRFTTGDPLNLSGSPYQGKLTGMGQHGHLFRQTGSEPILFHLEVVPTLKVEPESLSGPKMTRQP